MQLITLSHAASVLTVEIDYNKNPAIKLIPMKTDVTAHRCIQLCMIPLLVSKFLVNSKGHSCMDCVSRDCLY